MPGPPPDLRCPRCHRAASGTAGCPWCREEGVAVNLELPLAKLTGCDLGSFPGGPWGWHGVVPLPDGTDVVTLGEGNTPLIRLPSRTGRSGLWLKNEAANPTMTHKDRYMAAAVTKARADGAETVIAASSGNAGASAAAYAARAGLRCVVVTTTSLRSAIHAQIVAAGAVVAGHHDIVARNNTMRQAVEELGWFPLTNYVEPGAGGHPYAIEGFKSLAYELARDLDGQLEAVVVPTSRADLLSGIHRGFKELTRAGLIPAAPRLIGAEPGGAAPFSAAWQQPDRFTQERTRVDYVASPAFSIGTDVANFQGLQALWDTGGHPVAVETDRFMDEYRTRARADGVFMEASSAAAVAAADDLTSDGGAVVAIGTSTGAKDVDLALRGAELAVLDGGVTDLQELLHRRRSGT